MAQLTQYQNQGIVEFTYSTSHANAAAVSSVIFTADAHVHSAFPNQDYLDRDYWERTAISVYLQDGSGNPTVNAFKARVFISLDGKIWHYWVDMTAPNITIVDMPFRYVKIVRDNTTAGTVKVVLLSQLTHTS